MKATSAAALSAMLGAATAFQPGMPLQGAVRSSSAVTMQAAKSKAVPFLPQPKHLDGKAPGDVGFDPLGLSAIDFDFSQVIVPLKAAQRGDSNSIDTFYWMREAELKHGRLAMLAVVGWVAVDFGLRLPGAKFQGLDAITAHDTMVSKGPLVVLLHLILLLELIGGAAIAQAAEGSGRAPGNFGLDPLGLAGNQAKKARYELSEVKNGRLAMLAFGGIATQAVLTGHGFPYLF